MAEEEREAGARWYVVHTYSGYENKVKTNLEKIVANRRLENLIEKVEIPTEMASEIRDGAQHEVERKLFPGYVLVKMVMTDDSWYVVRNTRGVTGFVGPSSKPVPLTDAEVARLHGGAGTAAVDYSVGDHVQITGGPMAGCIGIVESVDLDAHRVHIIVSMFGRETPAEMDFANVRLV